MSAQNGNEQHPRVVVVMVALPIQGHLNQLLHFAHVLISYGIPVHFPGSLTHNRQAKLRLQGWSSENITKIHFHDFLLPPYDSPTQNLDPSTPFPTHFLHL